MSIRRSIAAAVFVAAVSAPTVLGATQAMAGTAPTGRSQPDATVPDAEPTEPAEPAAQTPAPTGSTEAPADSPPAPAAPAAPAAPTAPADPEPDEAALRARLEALLTEPGHSRHFREKVEAALTGTAEEMRHFLDVELPALIASDNRVKLSQFIADPVISAGLRAQALAVLEEGDSGAIADFLERAPGLRHTDYRIQVVQAMSVGGPEVRKAANAALSADTLEALRDFLTKGLKEAQERDKAAEQQGGRSDGEDGNGDGNGDGDGGKDEDGRQPGNGDSGAVQAGLTTTTTGTTTTTTGTGTELASTGPGTPLGAVATTGAAAIVLGAGTLVAARRRRQES
ncbi:ALF repeat-containing protein [Kitasatospora sp. NPDC088783]|uniref:ALF repeat-containing protein n=1 Tax=Kitasatospora sp. NPDC088783 TaxID=3364077 RepID=UPI003810B140